MSSSSKVCVVGSFMYDLVATAPRRPEPGETVIGTSLTTYAGGKGFNQAVAAARAGAKTQMVGRIGRDGFGAEFRAFLEKERIDSSHVIVDAEHGTGVGLPVVEENGQNSIIVVPQANQAVSLADIESARRVIENSAVLLLQLELPMEPTLRAARIAHDSGRTVILNPAPFTDVPAELADCVDILVPNEGELRALAGKASVHGNGSLSSLAQTVSQAWTATVVVTLGAAGVLLVPLEGQHITFGAHPVQAVDTIGAGDTFCGNLGARLALGDDLPEAAAFANAAAALAVTRRGGAPATPMAGDTAAFLKRNGDRSGSLQLETRR